VNVWRDICLIMTVLVIAGCEQWRPQDAAGVPLSQGKLDCSWEADRAIGSAGRAASKNAIHADAFRSCMEKRGY
jgi:hypothetical protein